MQLSVTSSTRIHPSISRIIQPAMQPDVKSKNLSPRYPGETATARGRINSSSEGCLSVTSGTPPPSNPISSKSQGTETNKEESNSKKKANATTMMMPPRSLNIPVFDAEKEQDVELWLKDIKRAAYYWSWDDGMHIFMIRYYAGSKVRRFLNTLPDTEVDTVMKISMRLKIQYGIEGQQEINRELFGVEKQNAGETELQYLERLVNLRVAAWPNEEIKEQRKGIIRQFV